jgi:hypothetical protein
MSREVNSVSTRVYRHVYWWELDYRSDCSVRLQVNCSKDKIHNLELTWLHGMKSIDDGKDKFFIQKEATGTNRVLRSKFF